MAYTYMTSSPILALQPSLWLIHRCQQPREVHDMRACDLAGCTRTSRSLSRSSQALPSRRFMGVPCWVCAPRTLSASMTGQTPRCASWPTSQVSNSIISYHTSQSAEHCKQRSSNVMTCSACGEAPRSKSAVTSEHCRLHLGGASRCTAKDIKWIGSGDWWP